MTEDTGVIPRHSYRAKVTEVGQVTDLSGARLTIGVSGSAVTMRASGVTLAFDRERMETVAQMLVRAAWLAGHGAAGEG